MHGPTFALHSLATARFDLGCACETATSPPRVKKFWSAPQKIIPHPNRSFFLRGFWVKRRCAAALAFRLLLVHEKEPTIHGDCLTIFKKYLSRLTYTTCVVSEHSNFRSPALPQYSPRIKYGGYSEPARSAPSHALIKTGKARAPPYLTS